MNQDKHLIEYYDQYNEEERLLKRYGQIEFLTTIKYIEKFLSKGDKILEIGAGTGRYSHYFAQKGYDVTAVELVQKNLDKLDSETILGENIKTMQGNAIDLSFLDSETFDITLSLGPMYHLYTAGDKLKAMSESIRVTRKGGLIATAYCMNDASVIGWGFLKGNLIDGINRNIIDSETFKFASVPEEIFELYRKEDIKQLKSNFKLEDIKYIATDLYTKYIQDFILDMDDETFDLYLKYHFSICEREDMIGISHHTLDIVKKV